MVERRKHMADTICPDSATENAVNLDSEAASIVYPAFDRELLRQICRSSTHTAA